MPRGTVNPASNKSILPLSYQQVSFPANSRSGWCTTCPNLAESHSTCRNSGETFSTDADGTITTSFSAHVQGARGGCCTANSCVGSYFESQVVNMGAGDKVYFDYRVLVPRPAPPHTPTCAPRRPSHNRT